MYKGFRYRIYPNASQKISFEKHFGCVRFAYNYALNIKIKTWESEKKNVSQFDLCKLFPNLKKQDGMEWLSEVCSHSIQCEMANLDNAYSKFFKEKKGFPRFKSKHNNKKSYSTNVNISVGERYVKLPKVGEVRAAISRPIVGRIIRATVSKTATDRYFVSLLCENDDETLVLTQAKPETTLGIDLGLSHFLTTSTGEKGANPRWHKKSLRKLARAQRKLCRRVKGSNNRKKQAHKIAVVHAKVANRRRDFQHKLSTRIIRENQAVALETLNVSGMQKNSRLARSIADVGWSRFVSMLEYKALKVGKPILRIGRFDPSSKLCSCGALNNSLKLKDRVWRCESCGVTHDRDILAANNIRRMAFCQKQQNNNKKIPQEMRESTPVETSNSLSMKQESSSFITGNFNKITASNSTAMITS